MRPYHVSQTRVDWQLTAMEQTEWRLHDQPLGWLAYLSPLPLVGILLINLVKTPPSTTRSGWEWRWSCLA